jgi:hypothetical protein
MCIYKRNDSIIRVNKTEHNYLKQKSILKLCIEFRNFNIVQGSILESNPINSKALV